MRNAFRLVLIFLILSVVPFVWKTAAAQNQGQDQGQAQDQSQGQAQGQDQSQPQDQGQGQDQNQGQDQSQGQDQGQAVSFNGDQLDNLVAPIALYPDPLLAQVLLAATFPDQIDEADRDMRGANDRYDIDDAQWDVSVKAVAHYPSVLHMMAGKIDWTTSLGQAYVNQSADVMSAVQRLRGQARDAGYLATNPQQEVDYNGGLITIYPVQPRFLYVPVYDPAFVYMRHPGYYGGPVITFGAGFAIGAWLNHDFDWRGHRVFYHGWDHGGGWIDRSRPFIRVNNIYVSDRFRTVVINRAVIRRNVNYRELNHYNYVHREVDYSRVRVDNRNFDNHNRPDYNHDVNNRIISRNINTNDPRIDANRGHIENNQPHQGQQNFSAFHGNTGIDPRQASQRGQESRQQSNNRPAPQQQAKNQNSRGGGNENNGRHK